MTPFRAGLLALALLALFSYFGFTKSNPFAAPNKVDAVFENTNGIKPTSPVRIAGVDVGTVKKVVGLPGGSGAKVTMEVQDKALPLHADAEAMIRTRIFLEGNFFVDIRPGSPSAPKLPEGEPIAMNRTSRSVQFGDVLRVLKADVRSDLRTLLSEFSLKGLGGGGAEAFNRTIDHMEPAYKSTSLVNDVLLGENPTRDLQRVLSGQKRVAAALTVDEPALEGLVTNLNTTANALAREDDSLAASIPALRGLLRTGSPALASLNGALPSLRRFAVEALPGVRSTPQTIDAAMPFIRQTRLLFSRRELRGFAAQTRRQIPRLVRLNGRLRPFLGQVRELSSCGNRVVLPYLESPIPSTEKGNTDQEVRRQINRSLVGLSGESRTHDANTPWFRIGAVPPTHLATGTVEPFPPRNSNTPPSHRPDVPCETQQPPQLAAPSAPGAALGGPTVRSGSRAKARRDLNAFIKSDEFKTMVRLAKERRGKPLDADGSHREEPKR